ncbi:TPA: MFS transporter [Escherichia coli]|uniref:MFS transporter n=1 Tax=Pseudomonadota TaxID=1224 RepID=UPI00287E8D73|nr:MFS transporter [Escherichia coli]HEA1241069.1 MFS transporter [Escherichia coli]HEA1933002.1 MFS transporter [Escherichia coli]HEA2340423.1 MFS transporter [Escherichia coli]
MSGALAGAPARLPLVLATACGLTAANLYYVQPLAGPISASLGLSPQVAGLTVTLTQLGYGLGLLFLVPLGDRLENRRLILALLGLAAVALLAAGLARHATLFLLATLGIGLGTVAVQVLVPYAAHMAPAATRGRVVGNVMSGLMLGIMLARPVAGFVTQLSTWPVVFLLSAALMVGLIAVLARVLPPRQPESELAYGALLASMGRLVVDTPVLRRRALYHAALFAAFSAFWTTVPLLLASPVFGLSQGGIGLFALAGAAGAVATPLAGRIADRGHGYLATALAIGLVLLAFALTDLAQTGSHAALGLLVVAAILLDFGVAANLTLGQRAIYALGAQVRSRLNGLYMATFFLGGAVGSALGASVYARGGWMWTSVLGMALPTMALMYWLTEQRCAQQGNTLA